MQLDRETCRRARLARDPRFDGRFFIGVHTTGIYCRPVCPARSPREENIDYYVSPAAASAAGLRPCLRCRPECAPGTPAWCGSSATVTRALRKISEGALDEAGVENLAACLGIGDRHLRRLFLEHLGAPPIAVAQTHRLLSAKRLLDETDLPVTAIAFGSGFQSVRRFNDAFRKTWNRTPRDLRKTRRASPGPGLRLRLKYRPPFDWEALLGFLASRAIPGVESVTAASYSRSIVHAGAAGSLQLSHANGDVLLDVDHPRPELLSVIAARARRLCDLDADPLAIAGCLVSDPLLDPLLRTRPGLRVPGAWDPFELGIRAILGQQVSVRGASTLTGRLVASFGKPFESGRAGITHLFPQPHDLQGTDLAAIGVPGSRARTLSAFAEAVAAGRVRLDGSASSEEVREQLLNVPGIGEWTAGYIAMRALSDPDGFPAADLVLMRAAAAAKPRQLIERAERWRPYRAYAALHLWQGVTDANLLLMDKQPHRTALAHGQ
jgi:AraC family transcriptional regulator of adaptative response / DNA-3-methyladenine glycosylase II